MQPKELFSWPASGREHSREEQLFTILVDCHIQVIYTECGMSKQ